MPKETKESKNKYDVEKLRANYSGAAKGYLSVTQLAVASAFDEEFSQYNDINDFMGDIEVDDSAFGQEERRQIGGIGLGANAKKSERKKEYGNASFSIKGTSFRGMHGKPIQGKAITVTDGVALDLSPNQLVMDPVSESAYIRETDEAEPLLAWFDKNRGIVRKIPLHVAKGRMDSFIGPEGIDITSDAPIELEIDSELGYKLKANGLEIEADRLGFDDAVIYRTTDKGMESNAGAIEISEGALRFDDTPFDEAFKLGKKKALLKSDLYELDEDTIAEYERELGIDTIIEKKVVDEATEDTDSSIEINLEEGLDTKAKDEDKDKDKEKSKEKPKEEEKPEDKEKPKNEGKPENKEKPKEEEKPENKEKPKEEGKPENKEKPKDEEKPENKGKAKSEEGEEESEEETKEERREKTNIEYSPIEGQVARENEGGLSNTAFKLGRILAPGSVDPSDPFDTNYLVNMQLDKDFEFASRGFEEGDKRVLTGSRHFDIDNPTALGDKMPFLKNYYYYMAIIRTIFGLNESDKINAPYYAYVEATKKGLSGDELEKFEHDRDEMEEHIQNMSVSEMAQMEADQRVSFLLKCIKNIFTGKFDELMQDDVEAMNMGIKTGEQIKQYREDSEWPDRFFKMVLFPPVYVSLSLSPNFDLTFRHDVFLEPSPDMDSPADLLDKASGIVMGMLKGNPNAEPGDSAQTVIDMLSQLVELQAGAYAALDGRMSFGVTSSVVAGFGFVSADASLFADVKAVGSKDDGTVFKTTAYQRFKLSQYEPGVTNAGSIFGDRGIEVEAGVKLSGVVGTSGSISSLIFDNYKKQLWKKNFASWDLAAIDYKRTFFNKKDPTKLFDDDEAGNFFSMEILHNEIKSSRPKEYGFSFGAQSAQIAELIAKGNDQSKANYKSIDEVDAIIKADINTLKIADVEAAIEKMNVRLSEQELLLENTYGAQNQVGKNNSMGEGIRYTEADFAAISALKDVVDGMTLEQYDPEKVRINEDEYKDYVKTILDEDALEIIATPERIAEYEAKKMEEDAKFANDNIKLVTDFKYEKPVVGDEDGLELQDLDNPQEDEEAARKAMVKNYLSKASVWKSGSAKTFFTGESWNSITDHLTMFASKEQLIEYEEQAIKEEVKENKDRIEKLETKMNALDVAEDGFSIELLNYYRDDLGGKSFFEKGFAEFADIDTLISFEKGMVLSSNENNKGLMEVRQRLDEAMNNIPESKEDQEDQLENMRMIFKAYVSEEDARKSLKFTVTPDEIINFETQRIEDIMTKELPGYDGLPDFISEEEVKRGKDAVKGKKDENGKDLKYIKPKNKFDLLLSALHRSYGYESQQRANENFKAAGGIKAVFAKSGGKVAEWTRYGYDALKNLKDRLSESTLKKVLKENIRIEDLIAYEEQAAEEALGDGKTINKDDKARKKHLLRVKFLKSYLERCKRFSNEKSKEEYLEKIRNRYFSGEIDLASTRTDKSADSDSLTAKENTDILHDFAAEKFNLESSGGYGPLIEAMYAEVETRAAGRFKERVEKVKELKDKNETDAHIYRVYAAMGGHLWWHGADAIGRDKLVALLGDKVDSESVIDKLSLTEMRAMVNMMIHENSAIGTFAKQKKKVTNYVHNKIWGDGIDENNSLYLLSEGYAERLERLEEFKAKLTDPKNEEFRHLTEEEKKVKLTKFYTQELGAGTGLFKAYSKGKGLTAEMKEGLKVITPRMLIDYEKKRIAEKSEHRNKRIKLLRDKKDGDDMSDYRTMVISDASIFNKINAAIRSGYKTGSDKYLKAEDVLDAKKIIDFEKKREENLKKKRRERLDAIDSLKKEELDKKGQVLKVYREKGGGAGFKKTYIDLFNKEREKLQDKAETKAGRFEMLKRFLSYKHEVAQHNMERAARPLESLNAQRTNLKKFIAVTAYRKKRLQAILEKLKANQQPEAKANAEV